MFELPLYSLLSFFHTCVLILTHAVLDFEVTFDGDAEQTGIYENTASSIVEDSIGLSREAR